MAIAWAGEGVATAAAAGQQLFPDLLAA